ncbi:LysE family translocator [Gammaproteobacteria bacterium AS21]
MMNSYLLYITIAAATIASPGPGVVFTISNTIRDGFSGAISGVLGIAFGMLCIALLSATSVAVVLSASALAFTLLKFVGAAYLIYLGFKLWRSSAAINTDIHTVKKSNLKKFTQGMLLTFLNPKPIFFFIALFPQFIDKSQPSFSQFLLLVMTFAVLVIIIHCVYGASANFARHKLSSPKSSHLISKISGSFYICFGLGLAASSK